MSLIPQSAWFEYGTTTRAEFIASEVFFYNHIHSFFHSFLPYIHLLYIDLWPGARYVEISFDGVPIFKGGYPSIVHVTYIHMLDCPHIHTYIHIHTHTEIRKATGTHSLLEFEACSECILFTTNTRILGLIEKYDVAYQKYAQGRSPLPAQ